jgi:hypothetical protein
MTDLFDQLFGRHSLTCPCGATCDTPDEVVVAKWIEAHKDHKAKEPKEPAK